MIRRFSVMLLAAILALPASSAFAACSQADATGVWQVYSLGYQRGYEPYWTRCVLLLNPQGQFRPGTKCADMLGREVPASGHLRLSSAPICSFTGQIVMGGLRSVVNHATLGRAKDHVEGAGSFPGGLFLFSASKR